jgi:hypothetical protein
MRPLKSVAACALLLVSPGSAWHDPVHARITRAALGSLPPEMQRKWEAQAERLIVEYSLYPDAYHNAAPEVRAAMRPYCEVRGRAIHNVTWKRNEDIESLEYTMAGIVTSMRGSNTDAAVKYAGVLAHLLEDSTCPAHALIPMDSPLNLMKELLPPPPDKARIVLHTVIENSSPEFDLGTRAPHRETAQTLLDRCYAVIRQNRGSLIELVRDVYADDREGMDRFRLRSARVGAELLADAYYSALSGADAR